ncbi:MAG: four helix bundle protein [Kiritimatiellae bacterium]|nr:four helix bundle protein [Kiritimatiellia bacterium]
MNNVEFKKALEDRTLKYAIELIKFLKSVDYNVIDSVSSNQVLRSGTSIGSNYREANRAESKKDFVHKIGLVEKEASETQYWMKLISETWVLNPEQRKQCDFLVKETDEFVAIFVSISKSSKQKK